jgi:O-antigen/teichoic acid export membrane protein
MSAVRAGLIEPVAEAPSAGAVKLGGFLITPARLRVWGMKSALALLDQGLFSGAGFAVNLLLARWMAPELYGAFAVAFAGFLFVSGFHNVLLLEPLTVLGPSQYADRLPEYFRAQIIVHLVLVGPLSAVTLLASLVIWRIAPGSPLTGAVLGVGLALPFLLLLWLIRRMYYVMQRPAVAVTGSGLYLLLLVAGLSALRHFGRLGAFNAFLMMACGGVLVCWLLLWRLGLLRSGPSTEADVSWRRALLGNWNYGRWLVGSTISYSLTTQSQTFLAATILGLGAAGILRAMQLPMLAMGHAMAAVGLLVLPSFSYDFGRGQTERLRHKAALVSAGLGSAAICFTVILGIFARPIERLLFGGRYAAYAGLLPLLALVVVCQGFSTGYAMAMRASQKTRFDLIANALAAPIAVASAFLFMHWWGVVGAAASMAVGFAVYTISVCCIYYRKPRTSQQ